MHGYLWVKNAIIAKNPYQCQLIFLSVFKASTVSVPVKLAVHVQKDVCMGWVKFAVGSHRIG